MDTEQTVTVGALVAMIEAAAKADDDERASKTTAAVEAAAGGSVDAGTALSMARHNVQMAIRNRQRRKQLDDDLRDGRRTLKQLGRVHGLLSTEFVRQQAAITDLEAAHAEAWVHYWQAISRAWNVAGRTVSPELAWHLAYWRTRRQALVDLFNGSVDWD